MKRLTLLAILLCWAVASFACTNLIVGKNLFLGNVQADSGDLRQISAHTVFHCQATNKDKV